MAIGIAIIGGGSLGKRHAQNIRRRAEVGSVQVVEPNQGKWAPQVSRGTYAPVSYCHSIDDLEGEVNGAIISTPTHLHVSCALPFLERGIPVLIEKPLAHSLEDADKLLPYADQIAVGYTMRFDPIVSGIKNLLHHVGNPLHISAEVGQYLPDWHPDEDYRSWYMAHRSQGGGAVLDLSHEIDTIQWLTDSVISWAYGWSRKVSSLEIDSDDLTNLYGELISSVYHQRGTSFDLRMDLIDHRYNRRLRIIGDKDSIWWDGGDQVHVGDQTYTMGVDRNAQFLQEEEEFLEFIKIPERPGTLTTYHHAFRTLEVALGIRDHGEFVDA